MCENKIRSKIAKIAIIITAAGSSSRIGGGVKKEYLPYKNGTVLSNCAIAFLKADLKNYEICNFIVTCPVGGYELAKKALLGVCDSDFALGLNDGCYSQNDFSSENDFLPELKKIQIVEGGASRQESVFNGLKAIKDSGLEPDLVLIHDGARPFVSSMVISNVVEAAAEFGASVPGVTPTDTQKEIDSNGFICRHLVRKNLRAVQTPQGFEFSRLFEAHQAAAGAGKEYTDDTEIWGEFVGDVKCVVGDVNNIKITYPSDLERL